MWCVGGEGGGRWDAGKQRGAGKAVAESACGAVLFFAPALPFPPAQPAPHPGVDRRAGSNAPGWRVARAAASACRGGAGASRRCRGQHSPKRGAVPPHALTVVPPPIPSRTLSPHQPLREAPQCGAARRPPAAARPPRRGGRRAARRGRRARCAGALRTLGCGRRGGGTLAGRQAHTPWRARQRGEGTRKNKVL